MAYSRKIVKQLQNLCMAAGHEAQLMVIDAVTVNVTVTVTVTAVTEQHKL